MNVCAADCIASLSRSSPSTTRSDVIRAIIAGYEELIAGDEQDYDRRHLVLFAAICGLDMDPDTLPDTMIERIQVLRNMC